MRLRRVILVTFCTLSGAAIIFLIIHFSLRFSNQSYIATLKAKGEPMEFWQIPLPEAPLGKNGAPLIINTLTNSDNESIATNNWPTWLSMIAPGKAAVDWQQSDVRSPDGTNTWEQLGMKLDVHKNDLAIYQNMTNYPVLDFGLDYQKIWAVRLIHLAPLRWASQWLSASTLYDLHQGNVSDACANIRAMLAIVKGQTEERLNISQQIRMAIGYITANSTWEFLQNTNACEENLVTLQQEWESLDFMKPVERAYLTERVIEIRSLDHFRDNPDELWHGVSGDPQGILRMWHKDEWLWFWSYADAKFAAQIYQVLVEATQMAETNHSFQTVQSFTGINYVRLGMVKPQANGYRFRMDIDDFSVRWMFSEDARDSFDLLRRGMAMETTRNLVVIAIAIKRYELRYHRLPNSLEELVPTFINPIPIDWMDGERMHYRLNANGTFLLYSVGYNGIDDGGDPTMPADKENHYIYWENFDARDWVWPQPATAAEVQKYYAGQTAKSN